MSPDGKKLILCTNNLRIFDLDRAENLMSGDVMPEIAPPSTMHSGLPKFGKFDESGTRFVIGTYTSPYIFTYSIDPAANQ
jgi:hypothetical protein